MTYPETQPDIQIMKNTTRGDDTEYMEMSSYVEKIQGMKSPKIPNEVDPKSTDSNAINQIRNKNNLSRIFEEVNNENTKNMHNIHSIQSGVSTKFD